ncbi:Mtc6 protein [Saccharomycopsis crataegensis]|uniref:Maintenance of telomere capping protein 6 n=1 Tax=Saccharomycopsis crataegensis TaxID=43959 RepID=A0AAV5QFB5_9ASCO|nr:Mtc6 protein [Saccharomycopsis crataegensis]
MSSVKILRIASIIWLLFVATIIQASEFNDLLKNEQSVSEFGQKTLSFNTTIDKLPLIGINASSVVFTQYGYTDQGLSALSSTLNNSNINAVLVDLYWNDKYDGWQICPISSETLTSTDDSIITFTSGNSTLTCDMNLTLYQVFEAIPFNTDSNKTYIPNLTQILFNLHYLQTSNVSYSMAVTQSISEALKETFGSALYSATDYQNANYQYPTLYHFTIDSQKTIIPMLWMTDTSITNATSIETMALEKIVFMPNQSNFYLNYKQNLDPSTIINNTALSIDDFTNLATQSWKFTTTTLTNFTDLRNIMLTGYTSIISNGNISNYTDINTISWLWQESQPLDRKTVQVLVDNDQYVFQSQQGVLQAYQCAVLFQGGWYVENCYQAHFVACQSRSNESLWKISTGKKSYFDASKLCAGNDDEASPQFNFSIPKTALAQTYLINFAKEHSITEPIWIDYNAISRDSCWVTGGPNSLCPFENEDQKHRFVGIVTPISVFIVFVLSFNAITSSAQVPVQKNRKYWKELVSDFTKNEYEGVPA